MHLPSGPSRRQAALIAVFAPALSTMRWVDNELAENRAQLLACSSFGQLLACIEGARVAIVDVDAMDFDDVLKVPHHGSDDVSRDFIAAVEPLVSVISAGDEDARRDFLHPRANLLGLLGRTERGAEPVIFVTNLAAFDRWAGRAFRAIEDGADWKPDLASGTFYARERTAFGIVHVRTDGDRLLVVRRGARADRFEPYAFRVNADGRATSLSATRV